MSTVLAVIMESAISVRLAFILKKNCVYHVVGCVLNVIMKGLVLSAGQMYHSMTPQIENANAFLAIFLTSMGIVFLVI